LAAVKFNDAGVLELAGLLVAERHAIATDLRARGQLRPGLAVLRMNCDIANAQMRLLEQHIGKAAQSIRMTRYPFLAFDCHQLRARRACERPDCGGPGGRRGLG
jgi:hypothetical protein